MVNYFNPKTKEEQNEINNLPVVIELKEGGKKRYFLIKDWEEFCNNFDSNDLLSDGMLFSSCKYMKTVVEQYGKEMSGEAFESGSTQMGPFKQEENLTYIQYRFKSV
ncbi:MAG: hypothetical protein GOV02_01620 [Candidatus Aenigmarchaeota archaeon]|nr:hypothetical protein [Candidatus Aenigmarchaeota archaeon]